jgi:hypothetical protein
VQSSSENDSAGCLGGLVTNLRFQEEAKPHAPPFDPLRRRARKPAGVADTKDELIRHYTFSESDLSIIRQRRG